MGMQTNYVTTDNRISWIDSAKGWALLCVIIDHFGISIVSKYFSAFHMPLFFFLSGMVFKRYNSFRTFLCKKSKSLLVPYVTLGLLIAIYQFVTGGDIRQIVSGFIIQKRWTVLWYMTTLWLVNILFYGITSVCRSTKQLIHVVCTLGTLGLIYYYFLGKSVFWNADVCLTATPFFAMGHLFARNDFLEKDRLWRNWGYFFLSAVSYLALVYLNWVLCHERFNMCSNHYGICILTISAILLGGYCVIFMSKNVAIPPVEYLGRNSLIYYGWHANIVIPIVMQFMRNNGIFQGNSILNDLCKDAVLFISIFAILYPVEVLFRKTKLRCLLGK